MDWRVRCGGGAAMVADNRVVTRASAIIPLLNRNTATLPIWRGFLGTFRPQHRFFCCCLKWLRNARGFDVVAVLRFVYPLGAQIALKGPGELIQIVAFRRLFPDPDRLRVDFELRKQLGDLVRADRLAVASPLRPRPALYPVQGLRKLGRCQPIGFLALMSPSNMMPTAPGSRGASLPAAVTKRDGHLLPTTLAMAMRGRQLSPPRLIRSPISGSWLRTAAALSAAQRAHMRANWINGSHGSSRSSSSGSSALRRCNSITIER